MLNNETRRTLISLANQVMSAFVTYQFDACETLIETLKLNAAHRNVPVAVIKNLNTKHPKYAELRIDLISADGHSFYQLIAKPDAIQVPEDLNNRDIE